MDSLNNECICEICKYLDFQDKINVAKASPDFFYALQPLWQRSYKILKLYELPKMATNLDIFFESIKTTVKELHIGFKFNDDAKMFFSKVNLNFPNVNTVFITMTHEPFDDLIPLVGNYCPNLTELNLWGCFTGKYICQLEKLERISLTYATIMIDLQNAEKIFKSLRLKRVKLYYYFPAHSLKTSDDLVNILLKCETLEEIFFYAFCLKQHHLDKMIVSLKQLYKVGLNFLYYGDDQTDEITGNICGLIRGVTVNKLKFNYESEKFLRFISRLNNLQLICFFEEIDLEFLRRLIQTRSNNNQQLNIYCPNKQVADNDDLRRLLPKFPNVKISFDAYNYERNCDCDFEILLKSV